MFSLSTELITKGELATVKEIRVMTFRALALCQSESLSEGMTCSSKSLFNPDFIFSMSVVYSRTSV